jgi:hypothetical protein
MADAATAEAGAALSAKGLVMSRTCRIVWMVVTSIASTTIVFAQRPGPASRPAPVELTGVLKGALSTHDGATDWSAIVVGASKSYLIVGLGKDYATLRKFASKRVVVRGVVADEFVDPAGGKIKLEGSIAGVRYDGNLSVDKLGDVALQPVVALTGAVDEVDQPSPADPTKTSKSVRLTTAGEKPVVYVASETAAKKLKALIGKQAKVKAFLDGPRLDDVESATEFKAPVSRPAKRS